MARKTGPDKATVGLVRDRSAGICEKCGWAEGQQIHHRKPRGMGGTRDKAINLPSNLLHLCNLCHSHIESYRLDAIDKGWLVRNAVDPAIVEVHYRGTWKFLDNEGRANSRAVVQGR